MALETLKGIESINNVRVRHAEHCPFDNDLNYDYILVDHRQDMISFKIQDGPIKDVGVNGCQVDDIIDASRVILEGLNKNFPCKENELAISSLYMALEWLEKRKSDRELRGVEGRNQL